MFEELERREHDVGGSVIPGCLEREGELVVARLLQPSRGERWSWKLQRHSRVDEQVRSWFAVQP
jgi:hypothetical protein